MSALTERTWTRPCENPEAVFTPGTTVRHRNPDLADWRGIVTPVTHGRWRGRRLRTDVVRRYGSVPWVYIRWVTGRKAPVGRACWYGVDCVEAMRAELALPHAPVVEMVASVDPEYPDFDDFCRLDGWGWPCPTAWLAGLPHTTPAPVERDVELLGEEAPF